MINVLKEQKGNVLSVRLVGSIEESVDFTKLIGPPASGELHVNCKEIQRINSAGIKAWIHFFQGLAAKGVKLKFLECSPAVVEQFNLIVNFGAGGTIESIYLPFVCMSCKSQYVVLFNVVELRKVYKNLPSPKCSKCTKPTTFDDIEAEYFAFLAR